MEEIMKRYSTTFIECVKEWPENIQEDIYKLYSYLRVVDEMVEGGDLFNTKEWRKVIENFHERECLFPLRVSGFVKSSNLV